MRWLQNTRYLHHSPCTGEASLVVGMSVARLWSQAYTEGVGYRYSAFLFSWFSPVHVLRASKVDKFLVNAKHWGIRVMGDALYASRQWHSRGFWLDPIDMWGSSVQLNWMANNMVRVSKCCLQCLRLMLLVLCVLNCPDLLLRIFARSFLIMVELYNVRQWEHSWCPVEMLRYGRILPYYYSVKRSRDLPY